MSCLNSMWHVVSNSDSNIHINMNSNSNGNINSNSNSNSNSNRTDELLELHVARGVLQLVLLLAGTGRVRNLDPKLALRVRNLTSELETELRIGFGTRLV